MMVLVSLALTQNSRKALVEVNVNEETHWLVAELPIIDDVNLKLEFDLQGTFMFREYEDAERAFELFMN